MKNIRIIRNCPVVLSGLLSPIGLALAIFTFLLLSTGIRADDFSGRVVGISDGDTISVMHEGKAEKVRLNGIDAPEKGQAFGNRAKQFVSVMAYGKDVKDESKGKDRYGPTIADVVLPDGRNLNYEIVKAGYAWWFRNYAPKNTQVEALESEAGAGAMKFTTRIRRDCSIMWRFLALSEVGFKGC